MLARSVYPLDRRSMKDRNRPYHLANLTYRGPERRGGEGYVELEIKCEECGFQGAEEYGFLNYRSKEDSMLGLQKLPVFGASPKRKATG
jgi:hypothetical protein